MQSTLNFYIVKIHVNLAINITLLLFSFTIAQSAQPDPWAPLPSSETNGVASQNGVGNQPASIDDAFDLLSNRPTASSPGKGQNTTTNNGVNDLDIFGLF